MSANDEQNGEKVEEEKGYLEPTQSQIVAQMVSDFVVDLLKSIEVPDSQLDELEANVVKLNQFQRKDDLMIYLCKVA